MKGKGRGRRNKQSALWANATRRQRRVLVGSKKISPSTESAIAKAINNVAGFEGNPFQVVQAAKLQAFTLISSWLKKSSSDIVFSVGRFSPQTRQYEHYPSERREAAAKALLGEKNLPLLLKELNQAREQFYKLFESKDSKVQKILVQLEKIKNSHPQTYNEFSRSITNTLSSFENSFQSLSDALYKVQPHERRKGRERLFFILGKQVFIPRDGHGNQDSRAIRRLITRTFIQTSKETGILDKRGRPPAIMGEAHLRRLKEEARKRKAEQN